MAKVLVTGGAGFIQHHLGIPGASKYINYV